MALTPIEELKVLLREEKVPFFSDEELDYHLGDCGGDVKRAASRLLIIKAENDSLQISGMTTADTSRYFLRLAALYRPNASGIMKGG